MIIKKEEFPEILPNTYLIHFNNEFSNYYFVNFKTLEETKAYIEKEGVLKLYNEWLDYIGNCCYVCEDVKEAEKCCVIAKVIKVREEDLEIEIVS